MKKTIFGAFFIVSLFGVAYAASEVKDEKEILKQIPKPGKCLFHSKVRFLNDSSTYYCFVFEKRFEDGPLEYTQVVFYKKTGSNFNLVGDFKNDDYFETLKQHKKALFLICETATNLMVRAYDLLNGKVVEIFAMGSVSSPEIIGDYLIIGDYPKVAIGKDDKDGHTPMGPGTARIFKRDKNGYLEVKKCEWNNRHKYIKAKLK